MKKLVLILLCILSAQASHAGRETGGGSAVETYIMTRFMDFKKFLSEGNSFIPQQRYAKIQSENPGINSLTMFKNADDLLKPGGFLIRVEKPLPANVQIALEGGSLDTVMVGCDLNFHTFCTANVTLSLQVLRVNYDRFLDESMSMEQEMFDKTIFHEFTRLIGINDNLNRQSIPLYRSYLTWKTSKAGQPKSLLLINTDRELLHSSTLDDIEN